ncbi:MAG: hypothetical protein KDD03_09410, partial [Gelidibacter sp.]|nr:hypothetical protein [Gelidibacter sp.]
KKIKDGFENVSQTVSDTVKNIDLPKQGNRIKSSSKSFFDSIGDIIMFFLKVFAKFIGILLMIVGASVLIGLIVAMFSVGVADVIHIPGFDLIDSANAANVPIWLISLLSLFAVGIPFFFLFYLGLKILVNNLKSIGNIAKFSLFGLWLMAIIGLIVIGARQASEYNYDASTITKEQLNIRANDTLRLSMNQNSTYSKHFGRHSEVFKTVYDENDNKLIYTSDIRLIVKSTKDSVASIAIEKNAHGKNYQEAKKRAQDINYNYALNGKSLLLDSYLTTPHNNKFRAQQIEVTLYLPEGTILYADENTYSFHRNNDSYNDILENGMEEHYLQILDEDINCLDCEDDDFKMNININNDGSEYKLDENGLRIKSDSTSVEINNKGVKSNSESVRINIDKNGIEITSDDN